MEFKSAFNKKIFIWVGIFALGIFFGAIFSKTILPHMLPLIGTGLEVSSHLEGSQAQTFFFIFLKNASVLLLCIFLGSITRGVFPSFVCIINGTIIGFLGAVLSVHGNIPWWKYAAVLAPHGVIELPAIFIGCAIGMSAFTQKEKLSLAKYPLIMLSAAACIETWVSTIIANTII